MITRVRKWGEGLGVRIPRKLARDAGIQEGTNVELVIDRGRLTIIPLTEKTPTLEELLEKVTPDNLHGEVVC